MKLKRIACSLLTLLFLLTSTGVIAFAEDARIRLSASSGVVKEEFTFSETMPGDTLSKEIFLECVSSKRAYLQISASVKEDQLDLLKQCEAVLKLKYADQAEYQASNTFLLEDLFTGTKHNFGLRSDTTNLVDMYLEVKVPTSLDNTYQNALAAFTINVSLMRNSSGGGGNHSGGSSGSQVDFDYSKELPDAGADYTWVHFLWIIGIVAILMAAVLYVVIRRKERSRHA